MVHVTPRLLYLNVDNDIHLACSIRSIGLDRSTAVYSWKRASRRALPEQAQIIDGALWIKDVRLLRENMMWLPICETRSLVQGDLFEKKDNWPFVCGLRKNSLLLLVISIVFAWDWSMLKHKWLLCSPEARFSQIVGLNIMIVPCLQYSCPGHTNMAIPCFFDHLFFCAAGSGCSGDAIWSDNPNYSHFSPYVRCKWTGVSVVFYCTYLCPVTMLCR